MNPIDTHPIEILHDGGAFLVVNKPPALSTQAPAGNDSLESRLRLQLQTRTDYVAFPHRLDRPVSGIILVALTKRAARLLNEQFASRKVHKIYLAWVYGELRSETPADQSELWEDWIRKIPDQPRAEICLQSTAGAKSASTRVQFLRHDSDTNRTLLELHPITGRMHQLRVQTASRGHGIVGDPLYESVKAADEPSCDPNHPQERIWLHAYRIQFHDPRNGRQISVKCPEDGFGLTV